MARYLVSYDLRQPGQEYPALIKRLEDLGAVRILKSQWARTTESSSTNLRLISLRITSSPRFQPSPFIASHIDNAILWSSGLSGSVHKIPVCQYTFMSLTSRKEGFV